MRTCKHCGSHVEYTEGWNHDDGFVYCGDVGGTVAEPEIEFRDGLGYEIPVESNSGSENLVNQNSGTKNGSDQKSGPPFKVEPAQPVTPQEKGGAIYNHFVNLTTFLYEHKNKFTKEEQLELLDLLDTIAGDIDDIEEAADTIFRIVLDGNH